MDTTESILTSVKKLLGIDESYTHFDADLIMHINSVFPFLDRWELAQRKALPFQGLMKSGLTFWRMTPVGLPL